MNRPVYVVAFIAAAVALTLAMGDEYLIRIVTRVCIYAMAAVAVDLLISQCGLASFGHAAFFAAGGYTAGILMREGYVDVVLLWGAAAGVGALAGIVLGSLSLRTRGLYFLMITLAFGQMTYLGLQGVRELGGDDGFSLSHSVALPVLGALSLPEKLVASALILIGVMVLSGYLRRARLGAVARAARDQPRRLASLGINAWPYNLVLFTISAAIAALAGAIDVDLNQYVSPELSAWFLSGTLLIMVIFGGIGSLSGPLIGATALIALEEGFSAATERWQFYLGLAILLRVLFWDQFKQMLRSLKA